MFDRSFWSLVVRLVIVLLLVFAALLAFYGCASQPTGEISASGKTANDGTFRSVQTKNNKPTFVVSDSLVSGIMTLNHCEIYSVLAEAVHDAVHLNGQKAEDIARDMERVAYLQHASGHFYDPVRLNKGLRVMFDASRQGEITALEYGENVLIECICTKMLVARNWDKRFDTGQCKTEETEKGTRVYVEPPSMFY